MKRSLISLLLVLLATTGVATAATYIVPPDEVLVANAEAIVVATALGSHAQLTPEGGIETLTDFSVEEVLKGRVNEDRFLRVRQNGGVVGEMAVVIPGTPQFGIGERVLLFMGRGSGGRWSTVDLELGKFTFVIDERGRHLLVRGVHGGEIFGWTMEGKSHEESLRLADEFLSFVRAAAHGRPAGRDYVIGTAGDARGIRMESTIEPPQILATPGSYTMTIEGTPCRRPSFSGGVDFDNFGTQAGAPNGGVDAIQAGTLEWTSESSSSIDYGYGGTTTDSTGRKGCDAAATVVFNDPNDEILGSFTGSGTLAIGGFCAGGTHTFAGETFFSISDVDVVVQDNLEIWTEVDDIEFDQMMAHELGHTLGFRHSNQNQTGGSCSAPLECTSDALMAAMVTNGRDESLRPYDQTAAQNVYGAVCSSPTISTQPASQTIISGATAALNVSASATETISYEWFQGSSGTTTTPVGTNSSSFTTPSLLSTTSYWVRVRNTCSGGGSSTTNSSTATVTVCTVAITTQPANKTISSGSSTTLSVSVSGPGTENFQWFRGSSGDTSDPISGASSSSLSTGTLTETTEFWVRVGTSCDPSLFVNSNTATVTVSACTAPNITTHPLSTSVTSGGSATLSVSASGTTPLSFQWFRGTTSGSGTSISGANSSSFNTGPLTTTTSYWVRVSNSCGTDDSNVATVTVGAACDAPVIVTQPESSVVPAGSSATVSVVASGTSLQYQWFFGNSGDTSNPIAGATSSSVTLTNLTTATSVWVRVTSGCGAGSVNSITATINVQAGCEPPVILSPPQSVTISRGSTTTLGVGAGGQPPVTYQWFEGESGDRSRPVAGATGATFTTPPLFTTTKYWVELTGPCGTAQSATVTVTVPARVRQARRR